MYMDKKFMLPTTKEAWEKIKENLITDFDLIDEPQTWVFVLSQIQNTKMPELECSYEDIVNHYRRWKIGAILQDQKTIEIRKLEAILEEKVLAAQKELAEKEVSASKEDDLPININGDDREIIPVWSDVQEQPQPVS